MSQEKVVPLIYKKINLVMSEVGVVGKNRKNTQGTGYNFRGIDDMYNALQAAMINHGVFTVPEVTSERSEERESRNGAHLIYRVLTIRYKFYCEDGSFVETTVIGEAMDSGDKATNKAMSVAHKYALIQVFCIPTEENKDPENDTYEIKKRSSGLVSAGGNVKEVEKVQDKDSSRQELLVWIKAYFMGQFKRLKESEVAAWKEQNRSSFGFESSAELDTWGEDKLRSLREKIERVGEISNNLEKKAAKQPSFKLEE
jgi:hypothetical protein